MLAALRFYATGSYQRSVGQDMTVSITQPAVSACIASVSKAINDALLRRYCSFPRSVEEVAHVKRGFVTLSKLPACIGAIDCTHIAIIGPSAPTYREAVYVNRKGYHSLNVQVVRTLSNSAAIHRAGATIASRFCCVTYPYSGILRHAC